MQLATTLLRTNRSRAILPMSNPDSTYRRRIYNRTGGGYEVGRYGERHMERYRAFRNDTLLRVLDNNSPETSARVLEVGCGTGPTLAFLAEARPDYKLFGIDASETMLRQAVAKGVSFQRRPALAIADAARLPYPDNQFDVLYATRFIHQFPHELKLQLWREFRRVLRAGGLLVLEFYARPYHWMRYYLGARKGRSRQQYFDHYPSLREVREIAGNDFRTYPLRLAGSKLLEHALGQSAMGVVTESIGRLPGRLLLDEYFVVARKR